MKITLVQPKHSTLSLPIALTRIQAGFPSPADDWLDLNTHLIEHPAATFFARVQGESMIDAGIHENDLLVIDRSIKATNHDLVVCVLDGEFTLKRIVFHPNHITLIPANRDFPELSIKHTQDFEVWGVVKHVIHSV